MAQPILDWLGPSDATAEQLLARAGRKPILALAQEQAGDFLLAFLKHGPRLTEEIWNTAKAQGLARRTLQLVRPKLGIHMVSAWNGSKNLYFWLLPGQKLPGSGGTVVYSDSDPEPSRLETAITVPRPCATVK